MASNPPQRPADPLDETLWRDPLHYQHLAPLTRNNIMNYFTSSPFYERSSNNGAIYQQMSNEEIRRLISSQEAMDARLKTMVGTEFMIAAGSEETGVWVIRKQYRRQPRRERGLEVEDVTVLATYYVAGENVYQAPSVQAVIANRMLKTITSLRSALKIASEISSYVPTASKPTTSDSTQPSQSQTQPTSASQPSQQPPPSTQSSVSAAASSQNPLSSSKHSSQQDAAILHHALNLSLKHQNEYMDDHGPLLGDPGSLLHRETASQQTGSQGTSSQQSRGGTATPQKGPAGRGGATDRKPTPAPPVSGVKRIGGR